MLILKYRTAHWKRLGEILGHSRRVAVIQIYFPCPSKIRVITLAKLNAYIIEIVLMLFTMEKKFSGRVSFDYVYICIVNYHLRNAILRLGDR